jgi:hypothetical protein
VVIDTLEKFLRVSGIKLDRERKYLPAKVVERYMMNTERGKMLAGELYNALDPELVQARDRARDLCQILNANP